jgi:hypothetical protein
MFAKENPMTRPVLPWVLRPLLLSSTVLCWALVGEPAAGQSLIATTTEDVTLGIQLKNPSLGGVANPSSWSSSLETDLLFRWGANAFVQGAIPLAFAGADFVDGTSVYLGNVGATFIFGPPGAPSSFLGFTLPTATNIGGPDLAVLVGLLPNEDEPELWAEDVMSVRGGITPSVQLSPQAVVGVRVGGAMLAPTDFEDLWVYGRGALWGRTAAGPAELRADLVTSYFINSDAAFADKLRMYLDARAGFPGVPAAPGIFFRLPLDVEAREALDFSVGLTARLSL